nr:permease-like cell division protein FtsX [Enterocloster clostridioformis]
MAKTAETTVGITVFFDEDMPEEQILAAGDGIRGWEEVREARYISAAQAWENFKAEYFEGMEELAEGFADDNPLSGSASYEIFLNDIEEQDKNRGAPGGHGRREKGALFQDGRGRADQRGKDGGGHVGRDYLRTAGCGGFPD